MKNHRNVRLRVEELESRLVPSAGQPWPYPTANWSGYSIDTAAGAVTDVKGSWNVPSVTVSGSGTKYAASWLGIDGDNSNTVEQIGTDSDQNGGRASYYAWYEMYPANFYYINWATGTGIPAVSNKAPAASLVGVNDTMSAEVQFLSTSGTVSTFKLTITDTPAVGTARTFTTTQPISNAAQSSAEWIVEQTGPLSKFSPETFRGAQATIGTSVLQPIGYYKSPTVPSTVAVVYKMDIVSRRTYLDSTGELNSAGDSFTVNYGTTQPPPPVNGPVTHGPMERLADLQVTVPVAGASSSAVGEISPVTPGAASTFNPVLANETTIQRGLPAADAYSSQPEANLGSFSVVGGEGSAGAGSSSFGLPATPAPIARLAVAPVVHGHSASQRADLVTDPTVWSRIEQPVLSPPSMGSILEDARIDRMIGAVALMAAFQGLNIPHAKVKPARPRLLPA